MRIAIRLVLGRDDRGRWCDDSHPRFDRLLRYERVVWVARNHAVEAQGLKVGKTLALMLDPARYALLDTPKPLTGRFHRNRGRTRRIFIAERPWSDHPIDTQLVDLDFRSARKSVNTQ